MTHVFISNSFLFFHIYLIVHDQCMLILLFLFLLFFDTLTVDSIVSQSGLLLQMKNIKAAALLATAEKKIEEHFSRL